MKFRFLLLEAFENKNRHGHKKSDTLVLIKINSTYLELHAQNQKKLQPKISMKYTLSSCVFYGNYF